MALMVCPECGERISDKCKQCIHCGYPLNSDCLGETSHDIKLYDKPNCFLAKTILEKNYDVRKGDGYTLLDKPGTVILHGIEESNIAYLKDQFLFCGYEMNFVEANSENKNPINSKLNEFRIEKMKELEPLKCPRCGSTAITTGQRGFSLFTGFIGSNKTVNRCGKCGYSWQPK